MMMTVLILAGFLLLFAGGESLVRGSVGIARKFGMSELVIGLTLVGFGTSLPELVTSLQALSEGAVGLSIGNVIGSNMFNLLAIIGIASLVGPIDVDPEFLRFDLWVMLGASLLLIPFVYFRRDITRGWGIALSVLYALYLIVVLI